MAKTVVPAGGIVGVVLGLAAAALGALGVTRYVWLGLLALCVVALGITILSHDRFRDDFKFLEHLPFQVAWGPRETESKRRFKRLADLRRQINTEQANRAAEESASPALEIELPTGAYVRALSPLEPFGVTGYDADGTPHIVHAAPLADSDRPLLTALVELLIEGHNLENRAPTFGRLLESLKYPMSATTESDVSAWEQRVIQALKPRPDYEARFRADHVPSVMEGAGESKPPPPFVYELRHKVRVLDAIVRELSPSP